MAKVDFELCRMQICVKCQNGSTSVANTCLTFLCSVEKGLLTCHVLHYFLSSALTSSFDTTDAHRSYLKLSKVIFQC